MDQFSNNEYFGDGLVEAELPGSRKYRSTVTVNLTENDQRILERIFGKEANFDAGVVANSLAALAFKEWLDWMSGNKRYNSQSDQAIERIIDLYSDILPEAEPEISFLYNKLNIPFGRARYIVQAIINKQLYILNQRALERLIVTLQSEWDELEQLNPNERKVLQEVRFVIDLRAEKLLTSIIEQMPILERPVASFKRLPSPLPNTREYSLAPRDLEPVLNAVKNFRM